MRTDRTQRSLTPTETVELLIEYERIDYQHRAPNMLKQRTNTISARLAVQNCQVEARIERNDRNPFLHPIGQCCDDLVDRLGRNPAFGSRSLRGDPMHLGSPVGNIDTRIDQPVGALDKPIAIGKADGCSDDAIESNINTGRLDVERGKTLPVPTHTVKLKARPDASRGGRVIAMKVCFAESRASIRVRGGSCIRSRRSPRRTFSRTAATASGNRASPWTSSGWMSSSCPSG